jgi:hypothetical protein
MIESLRGVMTTKPENQNLEHESEQSVESTALAGAAAIQQIITDRDGLREYASAQQRELAGLRAINQDLHRRIVQIRQSYVELGTKIITQLEQFDGATRDAMQDVQPAANRSEDSTLITLAHRLAPRNAHSSTGSGSKY